MKTSSLFAAGAVALGLATLPGLAPTQAQAIGCLSGAVAGGIAGHYAGHHGVVGAVGGCIAGHHLHNQQVREREARRAAEYRRTHPQYAPSQINH